jgi:hypothetical protein
MASIARLTLALTLVVPGRLDAQPRDPGIPHLRKQGTATQLVVDGAPFLVLGGELGNSSASSMAYMRPLWPRLKALHLNTIIAPAYWELIEPTEGRFEWSSVDSLIGEARRNDVRIVLLWFGTWKNSMSSYVPEWVTTNQARFPRTEATRGQGQEILAPYDTASRNADARAFTALMRHLREVDGTRHTVIMVQVENEIGMIPEARDHSARADALYRGPVPAELMTYLQQHRDALVPEMRAKWDAHGSRTSGTWEEVFGSDVHTEELFMAWHFARYTQHVAAAGKAVYPLPMYVNAALIRPGYLPGRYVSAGPLPHLFDVWRAAGSALDILSPDIYFPNFVEWTDRYARPGNPLFIPEASLGGISATNALYAIGTHDAIGFSPFAIESLDDTTRSPLRRSYALLSQIAPVILANQGRGTMHGFVPPIAFDQTARDSAQRARLGGYDVTVGFSVPPRPQTAPPVPGANEPGGVPTVFGDAMRNQVVPLAGALVIALGDGDFVVAGTNVAFSFAPTTPGAPTVGLLSVDEGQYVNGRWVRGVRLNGDQTNQGRGVRIGSEWSLLRVRLYRYR